ncbi:MAG: 16S rRNA (cytosine(1402)-N(4))-methyltransferase RsmH [Bdellovibrionales bacterium]
MTFEHKPVLLNEVLSFLPEKSEDTLEYLDCTFGRGGHALAIKEHLNHFLTITAIDRDQAAIDFANEQSDQFGEGFKILRGNFMAMEELGLQAEFDCILADLGVSSPQYDDPERGFSFYHDGPLDMRMDQRQELTAREIINEWPEEELVRIFKEIGEHPRPFRVIRAILEDRKTQSFDTTVQLSSLIERVDGWRKKGSHPATKYFMGLRLVVNAEIDPLADAVEKLFGYLKPGGRLMIISFHSTEDRIIKYKMREMKERANILTKKVIQATREEVLENPRSRTAKLRVMEKKIES